MAKKKESDTAKGGMKAKALPVVLLLVGLVGGKVFLGGGGGASAATAGVTTTTAPGPMVTLGSTTVNLADGHVLKLGLSLQLVAGSELAGGDTKADPNDPTRGWAPVLDEAIRVFGDQSYGALVAPGGRDTARQLLLAKLKLRYGKDLDDLYLYEFVMQ